MPSLNTIQTHPFASGSATDEARIAAILDILGKSPAAQSSDFLRPVIGLEPSPQTSGNRVYRSWREAADSLLETLEQERDFGLGGGFELNTFHDEQDWLPQGNDKANYVEVGGRGVPPVPRRITTPGRLEWRTYTDLLQKLAELNPHHPLVASPAARRNSIPDHRELKALRAIVEQEIIRTRSTMPIPRLERHHMLPKQHRGLYPLEIDIESREYTTWILAEMHRLAPKGMHTGPDNWNKEIARRLLQHAQINKEKIDRELREMVFDFLERYIGD